MSDGCPICTQGPAHFYDWGCAGCRARWLSTLPNREWRIQAVNEWMRDGEIEMVDAVKAELRKLAEKSR